MANPYVDYDFYAGSDYLGNAIVSGDFPRFALRASAVIDRITFGRAAAIMESEDEADEETQKVIQLATCAICDVLKKQSQNDGHGQVQSDRTGNTSISYFQNPSNERTQEQQQAEAAKLYLAETNLMFRGLDE